MLFRLGVEDFEPNHWVAFVFDYPGCFSPATTRQDAIARAPARIAEHFAWLAQNGRAWSVGPIAIEVAEEFRSFASEPDYIVNALFDDDRRVLAATDFEDALWLLDCARRDLMAVVQQIPSDQLDKPILGEKRHSIAGILDHVAWAEWWYVDRLGLAFPRAEMSGEPRGKLDQVRAQTRAVLPQLVGDNRVVEKVGEKWSARKIVRRALWHARDHTEQIEQLSHE